MPVQIRYIVLTMALAYGLSSAFLWWQQHPAIKAEPVVSQPAAAPERPRPPPPMLPRAEPAEQPRVPTPPPQAAAPPVPQPNYDGPPLPVLVNIESRTVPAGRSGAEGEEGQSADTPTSVNLATVLNSSDQPLDVTIIDVSASSRKTSQATALLAPGGRQVFGPDMGLGMESGDQITLRSRGFRDLTQTVP
jgi:hypothetical protein